MTHRAANHWRCPALRGHCCFQKGPPGMERGQYEWTASPEMLSPVLALDLPIREVRCPVAIGGKQTCRGDLERSYWEDGDGAQRRTWNECWQGAFSVGTISRWLRVLNCWSAEVKQRHTVGGSAASKAHSQVGSL